MMNSFAADMVYQVFGDAMPQKWLSDHGEAYFSLRGPILDFSGFCGRELKTSAHDSTFIEEKKHAELLNYLKSPRCQLTDLIAQKEAHKAAKIALMGHFVWIKYEYLVTSQSRLLYSFNDMIINYPTFSDESPEEVDLLAKFRNFVTTCNLLFKPEQMKFMTIAGALSAGKKYNTGGGASAMVNRRKLIYFRETGVAPQASKKGKRSFPALQAETDDLSVVSELTDTSCRTESSKRWRIELVQHSVPVEWTVKPPWLSPALAAAPGGNPLYLQPACSVPLEEEKEEEDKYFEEVLSLLASEAAGTDHEGSLSQGGNDSLGDHSHHSHHSHHSPYSPHSHPQHHATEWKSYEGVHSVSGVLTQSA